MAAESFVLNLDNTISDQKSLHDHFEIFKYKRISST